MAKGSRAVRRLGWLIAAACAGLMVWSWVWGEWGLGTSAGRAVYWGAFAARTFAWHLGVAAVVVGLLLVVARARRPAAVVVLIGGLAALLGAGVLGGGRGRVESGPGLTVMSTNLMVGRAEPELLKAEIRRFNPDVILVQEFTPGARVWMDAALADYPHRVQEEREHPFGMAVYSRLPLDEVERYAFTARAEDEGGFWSERAPQIRCVVRVDGRGVVIQNVHTWPPVGGSLLAAQVEQVKELARWAAGERRPVVVAGDFNATPLARSHGWLTGAGLVDGHAAAGRGGGATWPAHGRKAWLPGVRIDQVFAGGGAGFEWAEVGGRVGSDHRPIAARVRLGPG